MKAISVIFALLAGSQAFATEAKPLVSISSTNMLELQVTTITLKDDGKVYTYEYDGVDYTKTKEVVFARVQSEQQLADIVAAIAKIPADAKTTAADFESCAYDSAYHVRIFDQKFAEGSLVIKTGDCADGTKIVGQNAHWAQAIVRMIESAWEIL